MGHSERGTRTDLREHGRSIRRDRVGILARRMEERGTEMRAADGAQRTEDRGQRTEDRGRRSESKEQGAEGSSLYFGGDSYSRSVLACVKSGCASLTQLLNRFAVVVTIC